MSRRTRATILQLRSGQICGQVNGNSSLIRFHFCVWHAVVSTAHNSRHPRPDHKSRTKLEKQFNYVFDEEVLLLLFLKRKRRRRKVRLLSIHLLLVSWRQERNFYNFFVKLKQDKKQFFNYFRISINVSVSNIDPFFLLEKRSFRVISTSLYNEIISGRLNIRMQDCASCQRAL